MFFRRQRNGRKPEALVGEIERLTEQNRAARDPENERRLRALRHELGAALAGTAVGGVEFPEPDYAALDNAKNDGIPEVEAPALTPGLVRAALLRDGALIVRGVIPREEALGFADDIQTAVAAREAHGGEPGFYEEFEPGPPVDLWEERKWVTAGGLWAADSPKLMFDMFDAFERSGLTDVIRGYLNERPGITVQKCTMRKVDPDSASAWHQDGAFLGNVRALNVWASLSRCGDLAPGMDFVPRRLEEIVPAGTEGAIFEWSVAPDVVEQVAGPQGIVRPIFDPGDVILFDEMNLHSTAADPSMPNPRYAIESWFFGLSGFPEAYVPIAA
jgi:hypothetical protein